MEISWYEDGVLNASYNCIDRHVESGHGDRTAIIWAADELGHYERISYSKLLAETSRNDMLRRGQLVSLTGFGSGFSWGSAVVRW